MDKKTFEQYILSAGAVAVWLQKKRQCAGVDNNHTKMLSAVTAYYQIRTRNRQFRPGFKGFAV